ncbi:MAG: Gfo/Idh/MocA family oxidoreductase [Planctomycetaceae bacterium]|nr:Gfo/Idh/MocA family oxidoreductase [Planctomycetaceae bacterium]
MPADRREFLQSAAVSATLWAAGREASASFNQQPLRLALIGVGGMGTNHLNRLVQRQDVSVERVCDVDANRLRKAVEVVQSARGKAPAADSDLRQTLDDPRLEAVLIATPDHWHAPAALLALAAGKHVYVEKPVCHNIREGQLLREAVSRGGLVLQVGTQSRSTGFVREAIERLHQGAIGEVLVAKAWNSQRRGSIGKREPTAPPPELDFETWQGPAPRGPFRTSLHPAHWRWWHAYGCGDIGNDGVHDIDVALWGLAVDRHPQRVACLGGKHFFEDDQQFPDTQYAVCEYDGTASQPRPRQLIFEQRIWSPYRQEGYENGAAFYGTEGMMILGHTQGWKLYGPRNQLIAEKSGQIDLDAHHRNFIEAIRNPRVAPHADIHSAHQAATIVHLANISARLRRTLNFDPAQEILLNDPEAQTLIQRTYENGHWSVPRGV